MKDGMTNGNLAAGVEEPHQEDSKGVVLVKITNMGRLCEPDTPMIALRFFGKSAKPVVHVDAKAM